MTGESATTAAHADATAFADELSLRVLAPLLEQALARGGTTAVEGSAGSLPAFIVRQAVSALLVDTASTASRNTATVLMVVAHLDEADDAVEELRALGVSAAIFPALEVLPGETSPSAELTVARLAVVRALVEGAPPRAIVAPIAALMQAVPSPSRLPSLVRQLRTGTRIAPTSLVTWLVEGGYTRVDAVESPGEVAVRGGIVDVCPPGGSAAVRIDFFGDEIERMFEIDLATQASDRRIDSTELIAVSLDAIIGDEKTRASSGGASTLALSELLPARTLVVLTEMSEILEQARAYWDRVRDARGVYGPPATISALVKTACATLELHAFGAAGAGAIRLAARALPIFHEDPATAAGEFASLANDRLAAIFCENDGERARMTELLAGHVHVEKVLRPVAHLVRGFVIEHESRGFVVAPASEILHRAPVRRRGRVLAAGRAKDAFLGFEPGDYVVHRDHGIARFVGLQLIAGDSGGAVGGTDSNRSTEKSRTGIEGTQEFLTLEFDGGTKVHVPASRIELVQRYIGAGSVRPKLSTIGGRRWKRAKEEAESSARDFAGELLRVQAARAATKGIAFPADTDWQREFEAQFPYEETEDQVSAIAATRRDMERARPMDRLVCGDVGFGKTEVAMRAAFKAVDAGKQVAILVPTTVLCEQHERTFKERFRGYPFRVESVSRFKTDAEQRATLDAVASGKVDVIIGTHRILSKDVAFKDLGLVVVDEEQRFGVEHKTRLLEFRVTADVLTLSATPIPRTLHMAMLGLRDISSLTTAPADRRAIVTEVIPHNWRRIQQAIQRELAREGQIFFVHNRITDLWAVADELQKLAPAARIAVGHGQMEPKELEHAMLRFMRREADILVSTTIIESGIDIPTANTIIINNAHMFGLSELHQLRGRVGRWKHRAYCYLVLPKDRPVRADALKRLHAVEEFSMLGAGFRIAMRDLELRGAGNLLGEEQSGHICAVGYEMYCQLLEQAVSSLRNEVKVSPLDTVVDIGLVGTVPKGWIPSDARRMEAYRRIGQADTLDALARVITDLESAYGEAPLTTKTLLEIAEVRLRCATLGIRSVVRKDQDVIFRTTRPRELERLLAGIQGAVRVVGDIGGSADESGVTDVYLRPPKAFLEPKSLAAVLRKRLAL
ncbi:MAG: transcription-repair coupling factor [Planctomycetota bacterium]|nr:MAG: transcription-repair coupling factor [Planctomycetota bacterium]